MKRRIFSKYFFIFFLAFMLVIFMSALSFSENDAPPTPKKTSEVLEVKEEAKTSPEEEIEKIEQQQKSTEEAIKGTEKTVDSMEEEAKKALKEKQSIETEAKLKEEAAIAARKELEAARKEAKQKGGIAARKKVKELEVKVGGIEKEAEISKEKLGAAESKVQATHTNIATNKAKIEELKEAITALKKEKAAKRSFLDKAIMSAIIMFLGLVLYFLKKVGIRKFEDLITKKDVIREDEATLRAKTLSRLFNWLANFIVIGVVAYMVLENHGFNLAPLLAGAGIIGLAFGFGGQYLIRDLINGLFILIEGQYRINDVVKIGEYGGLVESIDLRITTLRDLEGRVIIIPNGEIKTVVNYTKEFAQALLNIGVAYKENVDRVMDVIKDVGNEMRGDEYFGKLILDELEMLGVDDFADSAVIIKFRMKTLPIKQWEVMREFRRRLKNKFDELGIEIPFPHRTLYWGVGEDNTWPKDLAEKFISEKKK
ncbi:MAG: mechanosensitive ion channel domain-containing protein [Candidatus Omnitrophota bacterium]